MDRIADPIVEAYATVLRMRRREAGLSQEQLAHRAGLSMRFISLLEGSRHRPTLVTMHKIAEALDLPLSEMIRQAEALPRRWPAGGAACSSISRHPDHPIRPRCFECSHEHCSRHHRGRDAVPGKPVFTGDRPCRIMLLPSPGHAYHHMNGSSFEGTFI